MAIKDHIKVSYVFENQKGLITRSNNSFQIIIQTQVDMDFEYASCILKYQISGKT